MDQIRGKNIFAPEIIGMRNSIPGKEHINLIQINLLPLPKKGLQSSVIKIIFSRKDIQFPFRKM
jgi:hypothetical protein